MLVTWFDDRRLKEHTESLEPQVDRELIELLGGMNKDEKRWSLRKDVYTPPVTLWSLFRFLFTGKPGEAVERFNLYWNTSGDEWQYIHFHSSNPESGGGTFSLTRNEMANFMMGYMMAKGST